ncbi:MAG TPA: alpha/beta fold hydrolase [Xanthobacteraceae bacterium]|jgi:3-oxoadipate enol-lactonase
MQSTVNGISINFEIDGPDSAPWLVLSNSLLTNLSMWDDQVAALRQSFRILRYDQRGHGGTQATAGSYTFDLLVADIIALLDMLGIKRAHFCGLSMGGMTALFLAQRHAQRFDRIIACDCGPASTPASAQQWKERIELAGKDGMGALVEPTIGRWFPPEFLAPKPPVLDKVRQMIRSTPIAGFSGCAQALSDYDLRPGLASIDRPTLLIVGTKDATLAGIRQIKDAVRGAALVELEGAGHISNLEQPAAFTRAVREFLPQA